MNLLLAGCTYGTGLTTVTDVAEEKKMGDKALGNRDFQSYLYWYRKAAEQGDASAQVTVGDIYYSDRYNPNGSGVRSDYFEAEEWYQRAVAQGSTEAMIKLGDMYSIGEVIGENKQDAINLYKKAIELGDRRGLIGLAKLQPVTVKAKAGIGTIPGALVCNSQALISQYIDVRQNSEKGTIQDNQHGQIKSPLADSDVYPTQPPQYSGCYLLTPGTEMTLQGDINAANVTIRLRDGANYQGVTSPSMIDLGR